MVYAALMESDRRAVVGQADYVSERRLDFIAPGVQRNKEKHLRVMHFRCGDDARCVSNSFKKLRSVRKDNAIRAVCPEKGLIDSLWFHP